MLTMLAVFSASGCDDYFTRSYQFGGTARVTTDNGSTTDDGTDDGTDDSAEQPDDDSDGLSNEVEATFLLKETTADSDADGYADGLEFVGLRGDPLNSRQTPISFNRERILNISEILQNQLDSDRDGLGNIFERSISTDENDPDSDDDGYSDGLEFVAGTDPKSSSSRPTRTSAPFSDGATALAPLDTDGDGLANTIEALVNGSPTNFDTDGDGFSDGIEVLMGSDVNDVQSVPAVSSSSNSTAN